MLRFPDLLPFDWNDVDNINKCYSVYMNDIFNANLCFMGKPIYYDCRVQDGKHACFWHLITRTVQEFHERYPNRDRMERIHWCPFIINNYTSEDIVCWTERVPTNGRGLKDQVFLWSIQNQYVVILEAQKQKAYRLVSAYCVDEKWQRNKFKKKSKVCADPRKKSGAQ